MLSLDRDAVICDLAETYGILGLDSVSGSLLATLAVGLHDDSRIKKEIRTKSRTETEPQPDIDTVLLARAVDLLAWLQWSKTKDGQKNRHHPESVLNLIMNSGKKKPKEEELRSFDTPEEFMAAWQKGGGGIGNGPG